ncbi:MAG: HTH-type transcriptional activator IlvY [Succinivibrio sp.]|nr:HTH-type transcriptional activator IlvY [Succinivibrio sp.]
MIDLKDAATFLRLCETSNLTRTASLCNVSPSTLSRTLNKLETELNTKLCLRDKKGVTITEQGRKFEQFARNTLHAYTNLQANFDSSAGRLHGSIKIFCSVTACYFFIPRLLNELRLSEPNLEIRIETGDPADALDKLSDPQTDFVIAALPVDISEKYHIVDLVSFPLLLIAPRTPLFELNGQAADVESYNLQTTPFIMPEHGQLRHEVEKWFSSLEITPMIYSEVAGHEAIVSLTGLGFGLSVVPRLVYDISPFKNDVYVLKALPWSNFRLALCSLEENAHKPRIKVVNEMASRFAGSFEPDLNRRRQDS